MNPRSSLSKSTADIMIGLVKRCAFYFLLSTIYCILLYGYPPGWSDDILLTPEDNKTRAQCDVDVDCFNNVWAVWDSGTWISGTAEVLYSKRDSLGSCLIPETQVSGNSTFSHLPKVAVDTSNCIQCIWRDASPQGEGIWHAKLANDGSMLVPSHLAVSGAGGGSSTLLPDLVIDKYNELYIIWDESPSGYNQMNFTRLDSLGSPIIDKIQVSLPGVYAFWPGIGLDSFANAHTAYRTDSGFAERLAYTKLDRNGNVLISNRFFGTGYLPTIIADRSQNIHMVYTNPAGPGNRIDYLKIDQNANILIGPITLSVHAENECAHMAMDSLQYLHVVWAFDNFIDTAGIMYAKMDTLGNFVIPQMMVVGPPHGVYPWEPHIAVDLSNRLHLIWKDQRLNAEDIFYKRGENEPGIEETNQSQPGESLNITITPNPFTRKTDIRWQITNNSKEIDLKIFDASGRLVMDLSQQISGIGHQSAVSWDGVDDHGRTVPQGVYFVRIDNPDSRDILCQKVLKVK